MTLSRYLILMIIGTLLCWLAWFLVVFQIDPFKASLISLFIFYVSLFLSLIGTFAIVGFLFRILLMKQKEPYFKQVKKSFRHSLFFALLIIFALILQSQKLLNWWNILIILLVLIFFEMYFLADRTVQNK